MQEACEATPGGMAAIIGLEEGPTRAVCQEADVELANLNCPGQIVISGAAVGLPRPASWPKQRSEARFAADSGRRLPFATHGGVQPKMREALATVALRSP